MTETKQVSDKDFLRRFRSSFSFDRRLFAPAVSANEAYCDTLFRAGILTRQEAERIKSGLSTILKRADYDKDYFEHSEATDVHYFIEGKLVHLVGEIGAKLKFGRTAEEQTLTALRLWLRRKNVEISRHLQTLQKNILSLAENKTEYFFIENGKEIYFAEWCIVYFEIWRQDRERLEEAWRRMNVFSRFAEDDNEQFEEIDYEEFSRQLKFEGIIEGNSNFAFDFALEFVNSSAILMLHQTRLVEDLKIIVKEVKEEGGFSILEFIKEKTSRIFGFQTVLQILFMNSKLKTNFSEVLNAVFETFDTTKVCLELMQSVLEFDEIGENLKKSHNLPENRRTKFNEMIENAWMELKTED